MLGNAHTHIHAQTQVSAARAHPSHCSSESSESSVALNGTYYQSPMFACFRVLPRTSAESVLQSCKYLIRLTVLKMPLINTLTAIVLIYDNIASKMISQVFLTKG